MAYLNGGHGKFTGVDENVNYAASFVGATKVAEKVKKGGTETKSDGYVVDAIDIDWGGLKLTTIADQWQHGLQTESSTEQNAGKGDNTKGIHSTAYLLNKISSSFTQIYNQIGKNDDAENSLRKRIKVVEDDIHKMAELTPGDLDEILKRIKQIEDELSDPGATTAVLSILDTLDGFNKNNKGDVKKYIDGVRGTATDLATAYTVYGVRKYVDTTAKENLIGNTADTWPTQQTLYGVVKYSDTKNGDLRNTLIGASTDTTINTHHGLKHILIGKSSDAAAANTIWGAKNYANITVRQSLVGRPADEPTADSIWSAKNYANTTVRQSLVGSSGDAWPTKHTIYGVAKYADEKIKTLSNTAFKVSRIEEGSEGILVFSTVTSYAG